MSLYVAIPYILAHRKQQSVGVLWLNSAETWIDTSASSASIIRSVLNKLHHPKLEVVEKGRNKKSKMGFPMIQVVLIAARQISKPVADAVLTYGKNHPKFRTKVLLPVGRFIVNFTTRLRMKKLGLGESTTNVSESAALEQASDFVQQVVIFGYSVTIFAGYYFYSKMTAEESVKLEEFEKCKKELDELTKIIEQNQEILNQIAKKTGVTFVPMKIKVEEELVQNSEDTNGLMGRFPFTYLKSLWNKPSIFSKLSTSIDDLMLVILTDPV